MISLAVLALSAAGFVLSVPLDLTRFNDRIEAAIENEVNGDVELGRVVVKVLPSPELTLAGFEARYKGVKILSADSLFARIRLMPLLSGKVSFEAIEAQTPSILLVRGHDGALNINEFLKKETPPEEKEEPEKPEKKKKKTVIEHLKITSGRLSFIDRFPMQTASFNITGINASSVETEAGTEFTAAGLLEPSTPLTARGIVHDDSVDGKASIKNLNLLSFNPYIKTSGARISGHVDADLSYKLNNVTVTTADVTYRDINASYPTTWDSPLISPSGSGKMSLKTGKNIFDLTVSDIVLDMGEFTTTGSVHIEGPRKKKSMELKASTTPVGLKRFLSLLPTKKMSPEAASRVRSIEPLAGTVAINELVLAGPVKELRGQGILQNPRIAASLSIDDASFRYRDLKTPFTNVSGSVSYKDRVFNISDLSGRYSRQILDDLDGTLKDLSGTGVYNVAFKGSFDVKDTLELARSRTAGDLKESLSKLDADGVASVEAGLSGAVRGKTPLKYSGSTSLQSGSAYYEGVPVGLEALDAAVDFNNERITLKRGVARTDSSNILLSGFVDGYRGKDPYFSIRAEGSVTAETLSKAISKGPEELSMTGAVPFTLAADGRRKDFAAKAVIDATQAGAFIEKYIDKAPGFPLKLEAEGGLKGDWASLRSARLAFGSSVITGSGTKKLKAPAYSASLMAEQLRISDIDGLSPYLGGAYETSGVLSFKVKTEKAEDKSPSYEGALSLRDGSFETGFFKNPVRNVNASASFDGNTAKLVVERLETGSTVFEGRVDVLDVDKRTVIFDLNFPRLHTDDLMPKEREAEAKSTPAGEKIERKPDDGKKKKPFIGSGVIRAAEGDLWNHQFKSLSANALLDQEKIEIRPVTLDLDGGKVAGSAVIFLDEAEPRLFTSEATLSGLDIERVTRARTPRKFLNGTARGRIKLDGIRGEGPLVKRLNGTASVIIEDGRLWKFGFITDIFSLVNIISLDELFKTGLPYKDITGTLNMSRGIISTSDIAFDSNSLRMSAIGTLRVPENRIDLTLALHPFVTIDKIITNIPIIGWIITGKEESTVSFYFDVEGPLKKPDVTPLPVKTLEKSIFGILERLLKAPFKLFD